MTPPPAPAACPRCRCSQSSGAQSARRCWPAARPGLHRGWTAGEGCGVASKHPGIAPCSRCSSMHATQRCGASCACSSSARGGHGNSSSPCSRGHRRKAGRRLPTLDDAGGCTQLIFHQAPTLHNAVVVVACGQHGTRAGAEGPGQSERQQRWFEEHLRHGKKEAATHPATQRSTSYGQCSVSAAAPPATKVTATPRRFSSSSMPCMVV